MQWLTLPGHAPATPQRPWPDGDAIAVDHGQLSAWDAERLGSHAHVYAATASLAVVATPSISTDVACTALPAALRHRRAFRVLMHRRWGRELHGQSAIRLPGPDGRRTLLLPWRWRRLGVPVLFGCVRWHQPHRLGCVPRATLANGYSQHQRRDRRVLGGNVY